MKKRLLSILLCCAMAVSMMTGCGNVDSEELAKSQAAASGTETTTAATEESSEGEKTTASNTFTIAIEADTGNTLNPFTSTDRYGLMTNNMLFAPLARMNTDGSIDYVIADSIETSEDGLVYTVKIKENLKWSDGEPLTAEDVVYSYNAENEAMQTFYVNGAPITFENPDDLTVVITLPEVSANAMELLTSENFVLPKHVFESKGTFDINLLQDEIVCSGPYTLKEYQAGQHLYFTKNPNYALGEAKTENVVFKIIEKADTASLALQNGDINAWIGLPDTIGPFEDNENYNINNYSEGRVAYIRLNTASENMQDINYRKGILKALDREEIMTAAYTDPEFFVLGYSFLPKGNKYYTEDLEKYEQNIEEAKELTANGPKELTITYVRTNATEKKMALAIQAELKEIGINAQIEGVEQAAFMDVVLERENSPYDIMIGGYVMGIDPYAYASLFVSDQEGMMNMMNYDNATINELFVKGNATLDETERQEIYTQAQQAVMEDAIFYPLGTNLRTLVTTSNVGGIDEAKLVPIYTFSDLSKLTME